MQGIYQFINIEWKPHALGHVWPNDISYIHTRTAYYNTQCNYTFLVQWKQREQNTCQSNCSRFPFSSNIPLIHQRGPSAPFILTLHQHNSWFTSKCWSIYKIHNITSCNIRRKETHGWLGDVRTHIVYYIDFPFLAFSINQNVGIFKKFCCIRWEYLGSFVLE